MFSWSLKAPLLSGGCDGLTEPSLFSPVPDSAPNSIRVSSSVPTNVGFERARPGFQSTKTMLSFPRVLTGVMRSSMLLSNLSEVHSIASMQLPPAPLVFGVFGPGDWFACAALWNVFTQALCLRPCPSRFQPSACAATCDYELSDTDDSAWCGLLTMLLLKCRVILIFCGCSLMLTFLR